MQQTISKQNMGGFISNSDLLELDHVPHLWNVNSIDIKDTSTVITGWSLPHDGLLENSGLLVNGHLFPVVRYPAPAEVYRNLYPWHPNSGHAGFMLEIPHSQLDLRTVEELRFESVSLGNKNQIVSYGLSILVEDLKFQIPDAVIAARIGVGEALHYTMFGRAIYHAFSDALKNETGQGFEGAASIVDWGSGSGRVARHVVRALKSGQTFSGFDIDAPAVEWSNKNIGQHFEVCELKPPLKIAAESVDVAFAYSVFTHLSEEAFHVWLAELSRTLKKGGTVLFTVLSDFAMVSLLPNFPRADLQRYRDRGIYDDAENKQLETIGVGGDIYRNTWVKRAFIKNALSKAGLEMSSYVCPAHFYQDLVVARKR
ncbi:MAG: class I SAM-dependent methyltransferase [Rhizobiaceae bacterium]